MPSWNRVVFACRHTSWYGDNTNWYGGTQAKKNRPRHVCRAGCPKCVLAPVLRWSVLELLEAVLAAHRDHVRIDVEAILVGLEIVVVQADAQVVVEVVAEAGTRVVLVAGVVDEHRRGAGEIGTFHVAAEQAAARAHVPVRRHIEVAVHADVPAVDFRASESESAEA